MTGTERAGAADDAEADWEDRHGARRELPKRCCGRCSFWVAAKEYLEDEYSSASARKYARCTEIGARLREACGTTRVGLLPGAYNDADARRVLARAGAHTSGWSRQKKVFATRKGNLRFREDFSCALFCDGHERERHTVMGGLVLRDRPHWQGASCHFCSERLANGEWLGQGWFWVDSRIQLVPFHERCDTGLRDA